LLNNLLYALGSTQHRIESTWKLEYLNIMSLPIQGNGSAQTGQTGTNNDDLQWHIGESSNIQKLKIIIKYTSFSRSSIPLYRCRGMPLGLGALGLPETKMPKCFLSEIEIFSGYFPKMAARASREVFCGKCGFMGTVQIGIACT